MTQENKELLLKDICARLPYGVKVFYEYVDSLNKKTYGYSLTLNTWCINEMRAEKAVVKPYLRSMSSMTKEEYEEYTDIDNRSYSCPKDYAHIPASVRIDWLNAHHFDYRGLIEKGLALEAPKGMYK